MNLRRVLIFGGCYVAVDPDEPGLDYAITSEDGSPATGDYRGPGVLDGGRLILGDPWQSTTLVEYKIAEQPTVRSVDYRAGYRHAKGQRVRDNRREAPPSTEGRGLCY